MANMVEYKIPLNDKIIQRFGFITVYHKTKEDLFIIYSDDPYQYGPNVLLMFDDLGKMFIFKGKRYTIDHFEKVLNLLPFF